MFEFLKGVDWGYVWALFSTGVVAATLVTKLTKNTWDDKWLGKLVNLLAYLGKKPAGLDAPSPEDFDKPEVPGEVNP